MLKIIPGILLCIAWGAVLGYWWEELTYEDTPGFHSCRECGPSFAQNLRWWKSGEK